MNIEGYKLSLDQLPSDLLLSVSGRCRHYGSCTAILLANDAVYVAHHLQGVVLRRGQAGCVEI